MIVSLMLIAAVMASLALGVLVAYGVCQAMFRAFRFHTTTVAQQSTAAPIVRAAVKG